ncbi:MAG: cell division protein ZapB [Desulfatiglans sp.]|jgi:chromosome segregation ATPase|nr:cell division protein ZapB [Desulfatiglans sp.]
MDTKFDIDQFQLLEEKVGRLIELVASSKKEKASLLEQTEMQQDKLTELTEQLETLKAARDTAKQRVASLLEKIEQIELL